MSRSEKGNENKTEHQQLNEKKLTVGALVVVILIVFFIFLNDFNDRVYIKQENEKSVQKNEEHIQKSQYSKVVSAINNYININSLNYYIIDEAIGEKISLENDIKDIPVWVEEKIKLNTDYDDFLFQKIEITKKSVVNFTFKELSNGDLTVVKSEEWTANTEYYESNEMNEKHALGQLAQFIVLDELTNPEKYNTPFWEYEYYISSEFGNLNIEINAKYKLYGENEIYKTKVINLKQQDNKLILIK